MRSRPFVRSTAFFFAGVLVMVACSTFEAADDAGEPVEAGGGTDAGAEETSSGAIADAADAEDDASHRRKLSLAYAASVVADQPIAYFRFREKTGPTLASEVGSQLLSFANNAPKLNVDGIFGADSSALSYDGTNGQRLSGSTIPMLASGPFAFEAWVWLGQPPDGTARHLVFHAASTFNYGIYMRSDATRFYVVNGGTQFEAAVAGALAANRWHHLVASAATSATLEIFVDNVRFPFSAQFNSVTFTARDFTLGAASDAEASIGPDAKVAELALYDKALTAERVAAHFTRGTAQ